MQRIKSFWRSTSSTLIPQTIPQQKDQTSFLQQATNLISSYSRPVINLSNAEFQQYLESIPQQYKKFKKNFQQRKLRKSYQSLKPQLVKRVYEKVEKLYFEEKFEVSPQFFEKNQKKNREKQMIVHQALDQVQVALFNQIGARFDEILSVLRTIESLDCLVDFNIKRIQEVRAKNFQSSKKVIQKQNKIVHKIQKQKSLQQAIQTMQKLRPYAEFVKKKQIMPSSNFQNKSSSQLYESIQEIKKQVSFLSQLKCCSQLNLNIQSTEQDLKKSFSQSLNQLIYDYVVGKISPYRKSYWDKFMYKNDILEEDQKNQQEGTVLLDESTIVEDDGQVDIIKLTLNKENEDVILKNIARGWNEGEYAVGGLKSLIQKNVKNTHLKYLDDFRQFCDKYLKMHQIQVSNPCLQDLLEQFNIGFFIKTISYYSNFFQSLIYRLGSITVKSLKYIIQTSLQGQKQTQTPLTIEQKQKLTQILDGIMNILTFVWKSISDKFTEVFDTKEVSQSIEIAEFKNFIAVIEGLQDFYNKKIITDLNTVQCPEESFLSQKFVQMKSLFPVNQMLIYKKAKLLEYLSKVHKNAIQIQLKQRLQNQIWAPTDIPTFYYDSLHFIITGQSLNLRRNRGLRTSNASAMMGNTFYDTSVLMQSMYMERSQMVQKKPQMSSNFRIIRTQIIIENQAFKVTETVLLLLQIVEDYMLLNQFYPEIQDQIAMKISQMFRSYNISSLQLIVHAGAVILGKIKTKSITAKHLALSTLCLRFCLFILGCISKRIKIKDFQKLYKDIEQHAQTTTKKLQTILKTKITSMIPQIKLDTSPSKGTEAIVNNTKILHDILIDYFDQKTLKKIFTKQIFTNYLAKIGSLKIQNKVNAETLKDDVNFFFHELKFLSSLIENFEEYRVEAQNIVRKAFEAL